MKWAVRGRWLSAGRYGRTEPEKLKGHLSNDRVETLRLPGLAHRELGKGQERKVRVMVFKTYKDLLWEAQKGRWRKNRREGDVDE